LSSAKEIKAALLNYSAHTGIRRVLRQERLAVIAIRDRRNGKPYRYVKGDGNYCYEIFRRPSGHWDGEVISLFEANQGSFNASKTHAQNGQSLVMRLHKDDLVIIESGDETRLLRVVKFSAGKINLAGGNEGNVDARNRDGDDSFRYLQFAPSKLREKRARVVGVDILGYVNDPGFKE